MRQGTRQRLWIALPILLVTLMGFGTLFATADGAATVFLPLVVRSPAVEEPRDVMPAEVRAAVVDDITDFIENLPHEDFEAETAQILARLRAHAEIETAVTDDTGGMIWATFSDGVTWYIFDDEHAPPPEDPNAQRALSPASSPPVPGSAGTVPAAAPEILLPAMPDSAAPAAGPPTGIPNFWYRLLDGLGPTYSRTNPIPEIQAMLDEAGYHGEAVEASLDELRRVVNDGVLYLRTHGLPGNEETGRPAAFSTSTLYEGKHETDLIAQDYAYGRISLMLTTYRRVSGLLGRTDRVYAINHAFIGKYWGNLADNSLVYIDACHGITFDPIIDVLRQKNASVIMGWNGRLRPGPAQDTSRFVFDRLLGANVFQREDPPQRPFDYVSVFDAHIGLDHGHCPVEGSTLEFRTGPGSFGLLAPSIKRMEIREGPEELIIHGLFGPDPAPQPREVTVQGEPLIVDTWDPHEIRVAGFTADKEGEVVVTVMERESNAVPITSWRDWSFRLIWDVGSQDVPLSPCLSDTRLLECEWRLDLRADVHSYRKTPGGMLIEPEIPFFQAAQSSWFSYEASGTCIDRDLPLETTWSGQGSASWRDLEDTPYRLLEDGEFGASGSMDMWTNRIWPWLGYRVDDNVVETTTDLETGDSDSRTTTYNPQPAWVPGWDPLELAFDGHNIPAGHRVDPRGTGYRIEWQATEAQHVPDSQMRH